MHKVVKTIADIAKLAGVSKSTVSRALNDNPLISYKTRNKIQEIARKSKFEVHQGARCLSLNRSQTIALIIPKSRNNEYLATDPFFLALLQGIMLGIAEYHYDLIIGQPHKYEIYELQRYFNSKRADGFILMGGCCDFFNSTDKPTDPAIPVITWGSVKQESICSVDCDNTNGARLAVRHLVQIGRKRIAFLGSVCTYMDVVLRQRGYLEILQEAGIAFDPKLVSYGDYSSKAGYGMMKSLLEQTPEIDGAFACSDLIAIGAMEALREKGRRVPYDTAVVGFDDIPLAEHCSPPLTTIRQNILKAGEVTVRHLMQFLEDGIITRTILPVELVIRKSTLDAQ
jgi:DNA-binding LacI/PurR family transcriptional regulator